MTLKPFHKFEKIEFSFYKTEEAIKNSCVEVNNPVSFDSFGHPIPNGIHDERMGALFEKSTCKTCNLNYLECNGHFGHINLLETVLNPMTYEIIYFILNSSCSFCFRFKINNKERLFIYSKMILLRKGHVWNKEFDDLRREYGEEITKDTIYDFGSDQSNELENKEVDDIKNIDNTRVSSRRGKRSKFKEHAGEIDLTYDHAQSSKTLNVKNKEHAGEIDLTHNYAQSSKTLNVKNKEHAGEIDLTHDHAQSSKTLNVKFKEHAGEIGLTHDFAHNELKYSSNNNSKNKNEIDITYTLTHDYTQSVKKVASEISSVFCADEINFSSNNELSKKKEITRSKFKGLVGDNKKVEEEDYNINCLYNSLEGIINNLEILDFPLKEHHLTVMNFLKVASKLKDCKMCKGKFYGYQKGKNKIILKEKKIIFPRQLKEIIKKIYKNESGLFEVMFQNFNIEMFFIDFIMVSPNKFRNINFVNGKNYENIQNHILIEILKSNIFLENNEKLLPKEIFDPEKTETNLFKFHEINSNSTKNNTSNIAGVSFGGGSDKHSISYNASDKHSIGGGSDKHSISYNASDKHSISGGSDKHSISGGSITGDNNELLNTSRHSIEYNPSESAGEYKGCNDERKPSENINNVVINNIETGVVAKDCLIEEDQSILQGLNIDLNVDQNCHDSKNFVQKMSSYDFYNLQRNVSLYFDSTDKTANDNTIGFKQKLERKEGLFRKHMMGKRVNYTARSVISPDPNLHTREIGLPLIFAEKLTFPEHVNTHNYDKLKKAVINGSKYPGAQKIELNNPEPILIDLSRLTLQRRIAQANKLLYNNAVVYRHIEDNDIVLVNRQPTLHKPSIMAHRVKVLSQEKTIRMHYANCNSYNADFDGDEMNIHCLQDNIARSEAYLLMSTDQNYLSNTNGKPVRGLVQDHVVVCSRLCLKEEFLTRDEFRYFISAAIVLKEKNTGFLINEGHSMIQKNFTTGNTTYLNQEKHINQNNNSNVIDDSEYDPSSVQYKHQINNDVEYDPSSVQYKHLVDNSNAIDKITNDKAKYNPSTDQYKDQQNYCDLNDNPIKVQNRDQKNSLNNIEKDHSMQLESVRSANTNQKAVDTKNRLLKNNKKMNKRYIGKPAITRPVEMYTGKQIITSIIKSLGINIDYKGKSKIGNIEDGEIIIRKGFFLKGILDKNQIGVTKNSFIHRCGEEYGFSICNEILTSFGRVLNKIAERQGYSAGIIDLILNKTGNTERVNICKKGEQMAIQVVLNNLTKEKTAAFNGLSEERTSVLNGLDEEEAMVSNGLDEEGASVSNGLDKEGTSVLNGLDKERTSVLNGLDKKKTMVLNGSIEERTSVSNGLYKDEKSALKNLSKEESCTFKLVKDGSYNSNEPPLDHNRTPAKEFYDHSRKLNNLSNMNTTKKQSENLLNEKIAKSLEESAEYSTKRSKISKKTKKVDLYHKEPISYENIDQNNQQNTFKSIKEYSLIEPQYYLDKKILNLLDRLVKNETNMITSRINEKCILMNQFIPFPKNNMKLMIESGAKGSIVNLAQISGLLGQQELEGERVPYMINGSTLPCFKSFDMSPQSCGYVFGRFLDGINPYEYFFHCMAGREGLIDTAVKTAKSGYLQRCLIKSLEGAVVEYDLSVRNENKIIQFIYGEDGVDTLKSVQKEQRQKDNKIERYYNHNNNMVDRHSTFMKKSLHHINIGQSSHKDLFVSPGEAVGILAGQGIGEPSTQMTLNTFHLAGVGSKNVTLGIPRLIEILMVASKVIKTPLIRVKLNASEERKAKILQKLKRITLKDITTNVFLKEDISSYTLNLTTNRPIEFTVFGKRLLRLLKYRIRKYCGDKKVEIILLKRIKNSNTDENTIYDKINDHIGDKKSNNLVGYNRVYNTGNEVGDNGEVYVEIVDNKNFENMDNEVGDNEPHINYYNSNKIKSDKKYSYSLIFEVKAINIILFPIIEEILGLIVIDEIKNIKGGSFVDDELVIEGTDIYSLIDILSNEEIYKTISNNIYDILITLGVEAARSLIISEIKAVFEIYGISIDIRHLMLIADYMTRDGFYKPFNRFGLTYGNSILQKMSFESCYTFLKESAIFGDSDKFQTPSSSICVGDPVKVGTGKNFEIKYKSIL